MTWIVSIDLSANPGSLSLFRADSGTTAAPHPGLPVLMEEVAMSGAMKHSEELFGCLKALLAPDRLRPVDIAEWWVNQGPGSFTGLRIALAAVKGVAMACPVPVILVNGAEARAQSWHLAHPKFAGSAIQVCTKSTATRWIGQTFAVTHAGLKGVEPRMLENLPRSTPECVVLQDEPLNEGETMGNLYWPSRSSTLLMAQATNRISSASALAAATPIYYAAREFSKQKPINGGGGTETLLGQLQTIPAEQRSSTQAAPLAL